MDYDHPGFLAGARQMAGIIRAFGSNPNPIPSDRYGFETRDLLLASLFEEVGAMEPRSAGMIAALADRIIYWLEEGPSDYGNWMPESAMTAEERAEARECYIKKCELNDAKFSNVIPFARR